MITSVCPSHIAGWLSGIQFNEFFLFSSVVLTRLSLFVQTAEVVLRASIRAPPDHRSSADDRKVTEFNSLCCNS